MRATDMAVVISQSQNEVAEMAERGIDIKPHRKRMVEERLEGKFKDAQDPLRIAFVCSMWTTGFDVPSLSTIYLDKPMRNHTLMQTITRANRVFPEKNNGLIVAYVEAFRQPAARRWRSTRPGASPATCRWRRRARSSTPCARPPVICGLLCRAGRGPRRTRASARVRAGRGPQGRSRCSWLMTTRRSRSSHAPPWSSASSRRSCRTERANEFSRVRAVSKFLADALAAYTERADISGVMGEHRAAPRRIRRRQRVPDPRQRRRGPVRPRDGGLGRAPGDVPSGTAAHRRRAPAFAALGPDLRARPAQSHAGRPGGALREARRRLQRREHQHREVLPAAARAQPGD